VSLLIGTAYAKWTTPSVGGLQLTAELDTNAAGDPVVRFPFTIPGFGD